MRLRFYDFGRITNKAITKIGTANGLCCFALQQSVAISVMYYKELFVQTENQKAAGKVTKPIFLNTAALFIYIGLLSILTLMFTGGNYISIVVVAVLLASFVIAFFSVIIAFIRKEVGKKKYFLITGVLFSSIVGTVLYQVNK